MADDVIDSRASSRTATVVGMVLLCSLLANYLQRFNNSYWYLSDSILAICIGFLASVPFCSYNQYEGSRTSVQHARVRDTRVHAACRRAQMRDLLRELPLPAATILSDAQLAPGRGYRRPGSDFDTIFFLYLVPPILFESGYSLNHKDFFRNFTAIVLFATVGTVISAVRLKQHTARDAHTTVLAPQKPPPLPPQRWGFPGHASWQMQARICGLVRNVRAYLTLPLRRLPLACRCSCWQRVGISAHLTPRAPKRHARTNNTHTHTHAQPHARMRQRLHLLSLRSSRTHAPSLPLPSPRSHTFPAQALLFGALNPHP